MALVDGPPGTGALAKSHRSVKVRDYLDSERQYDGLVRGLVDGNEWSEIPHGNHEEGEGDVWLQAILNYLIKLNHWLARRSVSELHPRHIIRKLVVPGPGVVIVANLTLV